MQEELKALHVLAVILLGGAITVDTMTGMMLPRAQNVSELRALTRLSRVNVYPSWIGIILLVVFGYGTQADSIYALDDTWLLVSQVLFWIAVIVSLAVLTPGALRLAKKVDGLPDGPIPADIAAEMKNPIFPLLGSILTIFFVIIVCLMVIKP